MKKIIIGIIGLLAIKQSYGQTQKSEFIGLNTGIVSEGIPGYLNVEYGVRYQDNYVFKTGLWYEKSKVNSTESNSGLIMIDAMYRKSFGKIRLEPGVGIFGGMEAMYSERNQQSLKNIVFGAKLFAQFGYQVSNRIGLNLHGGEMFAFNSDYGKMYAFLGLGINYNF